jgi:hypothetical protein
VHKRRVCFLPKFENMNLVVYTKMKSDFKKYDKILTIKKDRAIIRQVC